MSTVELVGATYGVAPPERRLLYRDARVLQHTGIPYEGPGGRWRLSHAAFAAWWRA